jgi:hypothetical protein
MSMHEDLANAIQRAISNLGAAVLLSPTALALSVQEQYADGSIEPHIQYSSLEHLKQMSRHALAGRYDPDGEQNEAHQGEMFSGHLQDRYPVPRVKGAEPVYKLLKELNVSEVEWNIAQLRKSADARLRHADALRAWAFDRGSKAA